MSWLDTINSLGESAANAYATVRGTNRPDPVPAAPAPVQSENKWLMPALIGGAVLIVVVMFMGRK